MSKSIFDEPINRYGTYSTQWDYVEDRFGEKDLLPFTISDMDFAIPEAISNALKKRIEHPIFGYTRWNHQDYKKSIINWYHKQLNVQIQTDWIYYSPSVIYSVSKFIEMNSSKGDGVVIQTPAYDGFFKTIIASKRNLVENPLKYENGNYSLDFNDLEEKLSIKSNKVLLFCSPHNPTGRVWSKEDLQKIVELCKKYDVFLISDEIHMDITHENNIHYPIINFHTFYDKMMLCTSASKSFNIPGLGGSYLFIPNEENRVIFQKILKNRDGLSSASTLGVSATIAAYNEGNKWLEELKDYLYDNLLFVKKYLSEEIPDFIFNIPDSTYLAWIDIKNSPYTMKQLQDTMIKYGKVAIMDGSNYGGNGYHFLRLNVACPKSKLEDGLHRISKSIEYLDYKK